MAINVSTMFREGKKKKNLCISAKKAATPPVGQTDSFLNDQSKEKRQYLKVALKLGPVERARVYNNTQSSCWKKNKIWLGSTEASAASHVLSLRPKEGRKLLDWCLMRRINLFPFWSRILSFSDLHSSFSGRINRAQQFLLLFLPKKIQL